MTDDQKIRFRCHRCKKKVAVPQGYVGRKVKCPGCNIVTIVPDIPGAEVQTRQNAAQAQQASAQVDQVQAYEEANDELSSLANAGGEADPPAAYDQSQPQEHAQPQTYEAYEEYNETSYETYEEPAAESVPRSPARSLGSRTHQWFDYLRIGLFAAAGLIVIAAVWGLIEFFVARGDQLDMIEKMGGDTDKASLPFKAWMMLFLTFTGSIAAAFICFATGMCCPIFKRMAQKIDQF
jgi:hypothetical protein